MTREEIVESINKILAEEFDVDSALFTPDANVKEALSLDSLSLVDLVALIQCHYNIKVTIADLRTIQTFDDLYDYILAHQNI